MRHISFALLALPALCLAGCVTVATSEKAVIRAKEEVAPALVHIRPVKEVFNRGKREERLVVGSGFILTADGYVVTNEHVAGKSRYVSCVLSDQSEVDAEVVGTDAFTDVAVLKLATDRKDLPHVRLGSSADLEAGQTVLALGSPHGLARSVSAGIVSVTDRYLESGEDSISPFNNWIQTDAAINPGNSGGPLVNIKGEVVGINTRKLSFADNVGFAIPIDLAKEVVDQIIANGRVMRSTIGVEFQEITRKTDNPDLQGVVIADVDPLSPAHRAGLRPGDIVLAVNGTPTNARFVEDLTPVRKLIADLPVGEEVELTVMRGPQQAQARIVTEEQSQVVGEELEFKEWGLSASELTPEIVRLAQLSSNKGVVISGTQVGGLAADARLRAGDIVLLLDETEVENLADFSEKYDALVESRKNLVLFTVKSGALTRFVLLTQTPDAETQVEEQETPVND